MAEGGVKTGDNRLNESSLHFKARNTNLETGRAVLVGIFLFSTLNLTSRLSLTTDGRKVDQNSPWRENEGLTGLNVPRACCKERSSKNKTGPYFARPTVGIQLRY